MILIGLIPVIIILSYVNNTFDNIEKFIIKTGELTISQASKEIAQQLIAKNGQFLEQLDSATIQLYIIGVGLIVVAIGAGIVMGSLITMPIIKMAKAADMAAQGNLEAFQPSDDASELGALSRSVYAMTIQLTEGMENLEQQVIERTREISRRNDQLEVAAQIGRDVSTILNINILLDEVTQLISERFGYYHVAVFMVDDVGEYAVMRAANSQGGKHLLAMGHKLKAGETGIVGYVAKYGKARVAYDVSSDQMFYRNPELPETRSEAAIPLRIRDRVIGVMDVQSIGLTAFTTDDMRVLQIVADQVALAVENTRLFVENRRIQSELEQAYGQQTAESWRRRLRSAPQAYVFNRLGVETSAAENTHAMTITSPSVDVENNRLIAPISIRGEVIGTISLSRESEAPVWVDDDLFIVQSVLEQIGPALESARLLEETQAHAMHEQAVNDISTQVRRSAGMDAILQNTVRELGRVLGSSRTFIQLGLESTSEKRG
jgi:GAF domain-containing protein/HAMP domain-containing protein